MAFIGFSFIQPLREQKENYLTRDRRHPQVCRCDHSWGARNQRRLWPGGEQSHLTPVASGGPPTPDGKSIVNPCFSTGATATGERRKDRGHRVNHSTRPRWPSSISEGIDGHIEGRCGKTTQGRRRNTHRSGAAGIDDAGRTAGGEVSGSAARSAEPDGTAALRQRRRATVT
jgi:hypothetical protein